MLINGGARLRVWESLNDKYNYTDFIAACVASDLPVMPASEFAQKVGMILVGKAISPDISNEEAYKLFATQFLNLPNTTTSYSTVKVRNEMGGIVELPAKPCCGGGQVR